MVHAHDPVVPEGRNPRREVLDAGVGAEVDGAASDDLSDVAVNLEAEIVGQAS